MDLSVLDKPEAREADVTKSSDCLLEELAALFSQLNDSFSRQAHIQKDITMIGDILTDIQSCIIDKATITRANSLNGVLAKFSILLDDAQYLTVESERSRSDNIMLSAIDDLKQIRNAYRTLYES
jgi:hypothetical protein